MLPLLIAIIVSAPAPAPREFRIDVGHSAVEFSVPVLYNRVRGRFNEMRGVILYDAADPTRSGVMVVIDARTLDTGWRHRDEHLRSDDFFDVERYPTIVFRSTRVERRGDGLAMTGPLTMHGVTRTVTVPFRVHYGPVQDPHGSTLVGFSGRVMLARKDFGILGGSKHNDWFDAARSATMGDSVEVTLDVEGWDTDYDRKHDAPIDSAVALIGRDGIASLTGRVRARAAATQGAGHRVAVGVVAVDIGAPGLPAVFVGLMGGPGWVGF